jgi:hypothetical protein
MSENDGKQGKEYPDPWLKLANDVLLHALEEAQNKTDLPAQLDAILWLAGSDAAYLTDALDIQKEPIELLTTGVLKRKIKNAK